MRRAAALGAASLFLAALAAACAGTLATPKLSTSTRRNTRLKAKAARLTAKKRAAWKPACPWRASNVQCRLSRKLLVTATRNAIPAATR